MNDTQFLLKVSRLCDKAANRGFIPVYAEVGDGIIIVHDSRGEFDTYFDTHKWEFVRPELWEDDHNYCEGLVAVLPGNARIPRVVTFDDAINFALQHLKGKSSELQLYESVRLIPG